MTETAFKVTVSQPEDKEPEVEVSESVESSKFVAEKMSSLPNTGENNTTATITGLGMIITIFGMIGKRRRKED